MELPSIRVPVLVVGGGPVGLAAAIGLSHFGVGCLLVERHPVALEFPKGRAVNARTMEIFGQWGIAERVRAVGLPAGGTSYGFLGETLLAPEFRRIPFVEPAGDSFSPQGRLVCSQELVERVLRKVAEEGRTDVRFGHGLESLDERGDRMVAQVVRGSDGATYQVEAEYVVAADGARSSIREGLGIGFDGPGALGESVSILVDAPLGDRVADRASVLYGVKHPRPGAGFAVVDNDRRWLLMLPRQVESEPPESFTPERCEQLVRAAIGDDDVPIRYLAHRLWQPTARWAVRMRVGRVFLAGDAAHSTTPAGGFGMTGGVADAHNLVWKLAWVLRGWADSSLLATYDDERRPAARRAAEASMAMSASVRDPTSRRGGLGASLGITYESTAVVPDPSPPVEVDDPIHDYLPSGRAGSRTPHIEMPDGSSLLDSFGRDLVVVVSEANRNRSALAAAFDRRASVAAVPETLARDRLGFGPMGLLLVRPDGYTALRAQRAADPVATVEDAIRRILGRGSGLPI